MGVPKELFGAMEKLVTATDLPRFLWLLLLVAVTPAFCEEAVFRGVLFQSLAREQRMWRTVAATALIFGAFHLSGETAIRFLPTAWIGVLMGIAVWRTRSIFASMLMHFVNNGLAVVIVSRPDLRRVVITDGGSRSGCWWRWRPLRWPPACGFFPGEPAARRRGGGGGDRAAGLEGR